MSTRAELRADWAARVVSFEQSGLSARDWCLQHGCKVSELRYWRNRVKALALAGGEPGTWQPLAIIANVPTVAPKKLKVEVGGASIEVSPGFDADLLRAVVQALGSCGC